LALTPAPTGLSAQISARICARSEVSYSVEASGDQVYVIPTASKKVVLATLGSWTDYSGRTDSYAVLNQTAGVPSSPTRTFRQSALASVTVESRRGPGGTNSSDVAVQPVADGCGNRLYAGLISSEVPTTSKIHLSPTSWDIRSDEFATVNKTGQSWDIGGYSAIRKVAAGKSYGVRFYAAGWGPGRVLPLISNGTISYDMNDGFEDPAHSDLMFSVEGGDKATATLRFNGKTVKTKRDTGWMPEGTFLSYKAKKPGWYTLIAGAVLINPFNVDGFARGIRDALAMPEEERRRRMRDMRRQLQGATIFGWLDDILSRVAALIDAGSAARRS